MKQEEKWPIFQPSPKMERKTANNQQQHQQPNTFANGADSDVLFEEMSGMVTLKRKVKDKSTYGNEEAGQSFDNHPGLQSLF